MSSRGATPGLHHRTGTQGSSHHQISLPSRMKHTQSFDRDYVRCITKQKKTDVGMFVVQLYQKLRTFFRLIRFAIRVCLIARKYALDSKRDVKEQIFDSNEILFDLSNFRRPVEVGKRNIYCFDFWLNSISRKPLEEIFEKF